MKKVIIIILVFTILNNLGANETIFKFPELELPEGEGVYIIGPTGTKQQKVKTIQIERPWGEYYYTEEKVIKHPENDEEPEKPEEYVKEEREEEELENKWNTFLIKKNSQGHT